MDKSCPSVVPQIVTCSELVSVICLSLLVNTQSAVWVMCIVAVCVHCMYSWVGKVGMGVVVETKIIKGTEARRIV